MADSVKWIDPPCVSRDVHLLRGKENAAAGKVVFSGGAGGYSNSVEVDPLRRRFRYAGDRANLSRRGQ
jgi:murein DD-endopeptidase MepM/ murein hydrolase activator NlpD